MVALTAHAATRLSVRTDPAYLIDTWETDDGLPENSATAMVQTPDGYLWFGSFGGLVRFDGVRFAVATPGNTPGLPSSDIVNLNLDKAGRLWVSTYRGLAVRSGNEWRTVGETEGWAGDFVRTFTERPNGDLLFTTFDGQVLEYSGGRFTSLKPPGAAGKGYHGTVDESGRWWVTQHGFVGWWDGERWVAADAPTVGGTRDIACAPARDGGVWFLAGRELTKRRGREVVSRRTLSEEPGGLWSLSEDRGGNVWICTHDRGVCRVAPDGAVRRWDTSNGLVHNGVRFVFEDREGNYWVGTSGGGLNRFRPRRFRAYGAESGPNVRVIKSVAPAPDGGVWVGSYGGGLSRLDDAGERPIPIPGLAAGLVQSVLTDRAGRTWVGTFGQGLWVLETGGAARRVPDESVGGGNVISQFEDSRGRHWVGDGQGVTIFGAGRSHVYAAKAGLPNGGVSCFAEDGRGVVWLTNLGGVFRWESDRFVEVFDAEGKSLRNVYSLKADADETMWMGSRGELLRWRPGKVDRIDARSSFPDVTVCGILEDRAGCFWMASNRGVVRATRADLTAAADGTAAPLRFQLLGTVDGLPSVECVGGRQPGCARDSAGRLWFATVKGVASIDPTTFRVNAVAPQTRIEELAYFSPSRRGSGATTADRESRLSGPFVGSPRLPAGSRRLEVIYTGLSLVAAEKVRFQVMLNGHDDAWRDAGDRRTASFYDLAPGDYVFRVRAANNDGVWDESGTSVAFTVLPNYWQTWWFRGGVGALLVLVGAAAAGGAARARHRRATEADRRFREVVEASPSSMIVLNGDGRITLVNAQAETVFGYARDELIGMPAERLVPGGIRTDRGADGSSQAPAAPTARAPREVVGLRKDGREIPLEVCLNAVGTPEGPAVLASIVDVSDRRQAELEAARQRNELTHLSRVTMLGELSGSLAHELNQPLAAILNNAEAALRFLERDPGDVEEVRGILRDIVTDDRRAGEVIHRLRLLFNNGEVQHQDLDLAEAIREVLRLLNSELLNHHVAARDELAPGLPLVRGDRVQLQQVLINLIINGCDAMADAPVRERRLSVRAEPADGDGVRVRVEDYGCGIAPDRMESVFEPFFTTKARGMGLGLAVCRTIIAAHGGRLWAENNAGRGASFLFVLPAIAATDPDGGTVGDGAGGTE